MSPVEQAFPRHARCQLPAPILARASLKRPLPQASDAISKRGRTQSSTTFAKVCSWSDVRVLGTIVQGAAKFSIVSSQEDKSRLFLLSEVSSAEQHSRSVMRHPNLLSIEIVLKDNDKLLVGYAYARTTLEDILNVHIVLGEDEIKLIASSVRLCSTLASILPSQTHSAYLQIIALRRHCGPASTRVRSWCCQ
jgi:hypothetical protein